MEIQKQDRRILQWHPAFYAGFQIELQREADNLLFENEHQLGTKPKEIDVLIIKKETGKPIDKNVGRIFRKYNIVEYKSPADYFFVDDFYRVYGYACFYKADSALENQISVHDITITLVCHKYPKSLARHLEKERQYRMEQGIEIGIMALVQDNLEEGTSLERICEKLQIRFGISREGAQEYIHKALNPQTI